ncbi:hypothetical protein MES4922_10288 [Mesorhizobium ventifaucium]|uniref:Mutator family transposase n=1 Tax=Mesorhizobium ventifaucium TaxID=666020 RepID=A0ABM9DCW2_9HYPH|nr:hypothetical protein MES4922_10288 [Mesorhizobium ventifaucium]
MANSPSRRHLREGPGGRIVSHAVIIAVAMTYDGRPEVLGVVAGQPEMFWTDFLRSLTHRIPRGVTCHSRRRQGCAPASNGSSTRRAAFTGCATRPPMRQN